MIIVGDSIEEIEIGRKFGMKTVAYTQGDYTPYRLKKKKPDFLIDNLKQLKSIIKKLKYANPSESPSIISLVLTFLTFIL